MDGGQRKLLPLPDHLLGKKTLPVDILDYGADREASSPNHGFAAHAAANPLDMGVLHFGRTIHARKLYHLVAMN